MFCGVGGRDRRHRQRITQPGGSHELIEQAVENRKAFTMLDKRAHPKRYTAAYSKKVGKNMVNAPRPWPSLEEMAEQLPESISLFLAGETPIISPSPEDIQIHIRKLEELGIINTRTEEVYVDTDLDYEEEWAYLALSMLALGKEYVIPASWFEMEVHAVMSRKDIRMALKRLEQKGAIKTTREQIQDEQTGRIHKCKVYWFLQHPALDDIQASFWTGEVLDQEPPVRCQISLQKTDNLSAVCHPAYI